MTDNEIFENEIKCITRRNECLCNGGTDCIKCDLLMDSEEILKCYNRALKNIDLINRQKAEIERLQKQINNADDHCRDFMEITKIATIKEFTERLKKIMVATHKDINGYCHYRTEDCDIDNLVKEMTGSD